MNRALRLWSAVSWWLVPLAIVVLGAVDLAQNGSMSSSPGSTMMFPGPVAAHAGFLLLVTVPLCWRFRAPATVAIVVTVAAAVWVLVMFSAKAQPPIEPWLAMLVSVFALASRVDGRRLWVAASIAGGLFLAGEIRGELAGQGAGNVLPAVVFYVLVFVLGGWCTRTGGVPQASKTVPKGWNASRTPWPPGPWPPNDPGSPASCTMSSRTA